MRRSGWRGRIALGLTALVAPTLAGGLMIGKDGSRGGAKLLSRMVGARDVALGLGTVIALDRGAPVRGWLGPPPWRTAPTPLPPPGPKELSRGTCAGVATVASAAAAVGMCARPRARSAAGCGPRAP